MKTTAVLSSLMLVTIVSLVSCTKENKESTDLKDIEKEEVTPKKAAFITDAEKLAMINSMKNVDGQGRLYEINYNVDYKLDAVLESGKTGIMPLFGYIQAILFDKLPSSPSNAKFGAGCSAFAVPEEGGMEFLMGRNYDFRHFTADGKSYLPTSAILVHTAPENGKKSISMVDGLNLYFGKGFYEQNIDLSMMMALPYAALDGINEDGFAIGVLALKEKPTVQQTGKKKIATTVAIRMLLDKASSVKEAIKLLKNYDMDMSATGSMAPVGAESKDYTNYHFFMADAAGDFAIVEYTGFGQQSPDKMEVLTGNDTLRCVTNFYVSPSMEQALDGWNSTHGKKRYETMRNTLKQWNYTLSEDNAMTLLNNVSQPPTEELTSQTQWSSLYNLSERSLRLAILREYGKQYNFKVE